MGIFGGERGEGAPHPRQEPVFDAPLSPEALKEAFGGSADFMCRRVAAGEGEVILCTLEGMVRTERVNDYILRPLALDERLRGCSGAERYRRLAEGGVCTLSVKEIGDTDAGVFALMDGWAVLLFPGLEKGLACAVPTEEKRAVSDPKDEPAVKGAKDAFVESLRTNTSLVRRRMRSVHLRIREETVGRQTRTPVDLLYLEGMAEQGTVEAVAARLREMDVEGALDAGHIEQYLCGRLDTAFPQILTTQRPDRFCANLLAGRVGVVADGIPLGFLLPGTVGLFLASEQDRTDNWVVSAFITLLRYAALGLTLFLPAAYVAAVLFHPEMIPLPLAQAIITARGSVPFGALFEAVMLLLAFEVLQEAGLRLPSNLGQTVGILGGLVVGSAAVEAKLISPAVLIVVAMAGVAGYTIPSQDFAGGVRLWRLGLTLAGGLGGLLGVTLVGAVLAGHLAGLEPFGVPYLTPLAQREGRHALLRVPFPHVKLRPAALRSRNRRNQR